jgi:hypothetical protein
MTTTKAMTTKGWIIAVTSRLYVSDVSPVTLPVLGSVSFNTAAFNELNSAMDTEKITVITAAASAIEGASAALKNPDPFKAARSSSNARVVILTSLGSVQNFFNLFSTSSTEPWR